MGNTDRDWEYWGKNDAYFGVLSEDRFRTEAVETHRDDFFASGKSQITHRLAHLEAVLGPVPRQRALDFGCGVGRMTMPLADRFQDVIGLDISPSMLDEARANAAACQRENIAYARSDDALSNAPGLFDFVHTYIVLQHIPRIRGMAIIDRLAERVASGGVISLHLCIDRNIRRGQALSYWLRYNVPPYQRLVNRLNGRPGAQPPMQMNAYSLPAVLAALNRAGIATAIVDMEQHGDFMTAYVAGRRA